MPPLPSREPSRATIGDLAAALAEMRDALVGASLMLNDLRFNVDVDDRECAEVQSQEQLKRLL